MTFLQFHSVRICRKEEGLNKMVDTFSESWLEQGRSLRGHRDLFIQRCVVSLLVTWPPNEEWGSHFPNTLICQILTYHSLCIESIGCFGIIDAVQSFLMFALLEFVLWHDNRTLIYVLLNLASLQCRERWIKGIIICGAERWIIEMMYLRWFK